jgi:alpha-tubulin suppressor-like RCC1 family protein
LAIAPSAITATYPKEVYTNSEDVWVMVSAAAGASFALHSNGNLWGWGTNWSIDQRPEDWRTPSIIMNDITAVSAGRHHAMAIRSDGSLWAWGRNESGQLGDGTIVNQLSPVKVMEDVIAISTGYAHSMAITFDGSLWAWGRNESGQLGDGTVTNRLVPTKIMENVIDLSAGTSHSAAITDDGALWIWGNNCHGQLGNGTTTQHIRPIKIMYDMVYVELGPGHSFAIHEDGGLWVWGGVEFGWTGGIMHIITGSPDRLSPIWVMGDVTSISTSLVHAMAIRADGSLLAWGHNNTGQLGIGSERFAGDSAPFKIMENVSVVAAGGDLMGPLYHAHTLAITSDGSLWAWGSAVYGQIGDGASGGLTRRSPVRILIDVGDDDNE